MTDVEPIAPRAPTLPPRRAKYRLRSNGSRSRPPQRATADDGKTARERPYVWPVHRRISALAERCAVLERVLGGVLDDLAARLEGERP